MKNFKNFFIHFIFGLFILFIGYFLGFWANFYYLSYKFDPVRLSNKEALKDIYGGKNPKETYNLFVSALKQGDLELASKYFILGKQSEKLDEFKKIKEKGEMEKYIEDLPEWGEMRENGSPEGEDREFLYSVNVSEKIEFIDKLTGKKETILPGVYNNSLIFRLNIKNNIWKIEQF